MRTPTVIAAILLLAGCESMSQKVDASRQDRCERADWALVGERDGASGSPLLAIVTSTSAARCSRPSRTRQGFQKGRDA